MKTSIFGKFSVLFTTIIVLTSVLSCVLMYNFIEKYTIDSRREDMCAAIDDLEVLLIQYMVAVNNGITESGEWSSESAKEDCENKLQRFKERMEFYYKQLDSHIYLSGVDGELLFSYPYLPNVDTLDAAEYLPKTVYSKMIVRDAEGKAAYYFREKKQYYMGDSDEVKVDENGFSESLGDFYGLYSGYDVSVFTVSKIIYFTYPDTYIPAQYGKITFCASMEEVAQARSTMLRYFILSTIVAIAVELIIILWVTRRMTRPIREVEYLTKNLAKGNYKSKIEKTTNDEIGALIDSYNNLTDELAKLDKVRSDFIAAVSHELRTPMTTIRGFVDGMIDGVIPPTRQAHYLNVIKEEIIRMNGLVNDLLDMTRLQSGAVQLDIQSHDIIQIIRGVVTKLEPIIKEKDINIMYHFSCDSCHVATDRASIERVLINLIQNAVKFTSNGGKIVLSVKRNDNNVLVSVADNGIGIASEELPFIFERFYKADKSRGLDKKGTGLGLAITKSIIEAHGQTIKVVSKINEGTKFTFTLQRKDS